MMIPMFLIILGGSFGIPALFRKLPTDTRLAVLGRLEGADPVLIVLWGVGALLLFDAGLLLLGARLFRRDRLISD
jgi:hypothetical protein